jgi:hypothetical protein
MGRALQEWKSEIIDDLGGESAISAQERAVLEIVIRLKLMLDSIDAYILAQPSLVNRRKKSLLPVVRERNVLSDSLVKHLSALGLKRVEPPVPSLQEYLASKAAERSEDIEIGSAVDNRAKSVQEPTSQERLSDEEEGVDV